MLGTTLSNTSHVHRLKPVGRLNRVQIDRAAHHVTLWDRQKAELGLKTLAAGDARGDAWNEGGGANLTPPQPCRGRPMESMTDVTWEDLFDRLK